MSAFAAFAVFTWVCLCSNGHWVVLFQEEENSLCSFQLAKSVNISRGAEYHFTWDLINLTTRQRKTQTKIWHSLNIKISILKLKMRHPLIHKRKIILTKILRTLNRCFFKNPLYNLDRTNNQIQITYL